MGSKIVESPCTNICKIDKPSGLCEGCGRTMDEIASWRTLSSHERKSIMNSIPRRMQKIRKTPVTSIEGDNK